eukprot:TRINITY_DN3672_c0_g1_i10.p1 TRINITY_DN3672_c0_g1~~TRINITY_DN3672_c0_g1_i10.p1  ORF type:complete len:197 (+),score=37.24 TRINITY_DN3672_c0_g1_i10:217-807(+)
MGGGMTSAQAGLVEGGLGGGGGLALFSEDNTAVPSLAIGGGGGGDLTGCAGSTDFAQKTPVDSISAARVSLMAEQVRNCPKGELSVVGGGGGGMGFVFVADSNQSAVSAYGGGLDLKFMNTDAVANDAKCSGLLLQNNQTRSSSFGSIHQASSKCRDQCQDHALQGLGAYWKCTCPCNKEAFTQLNLTFASKMTCA